MNWIDKLNQELEDRRKNNSTPEYKEESKQRMHSWIATQGGKSVIKKLNEKNKKNNHFSKLADSKIGVPRDEETKKKIKEGSSHSWKPILQFTKDGKFVREWKNFTSIKEELGFHHTNICQVCRNNPKYKTAYGFVWKYKDEK